MVRAVNELSGEVNGRFGEAAWTPLRYINRSYSRPELAGLFRVAAAALVTPLRDGMNLVAKEYIAAQDPEDPGVLVLSQVRRSGGGARGGAHRQSARDRRHGAGHAIGAGNAAGRRGRPGIPPCTSASSAMTSTGGPRRSWRGCRKLDDRS